MRILMALVIALAVSAGQAFATNWSSLIEPKVGSGTAIDLDSIRKVSPDNTRFIEVSWKYYQRKEQLQGQDSNDNRWDSVLDCADFSIRNDFYWGERNRFSPGREYSRLDLSTGKHGAAEDIRGECSLCEYRHGYPSWSDSQGTSSSLLLRNVCARFQADWQEQWLKPLPKEDCESVESSYVYEKRLCAGAQDELGDFRILAHRLAQLSKMCPGTEGDNKKLVLFYLAKAMSCKDDACLIEVYKNSWPFPAIEKTLRKMAKGEQCTFVAEQWAHIEAEERKASAVAVSKEALGTCRMQYISRLDDGVSPADAIASAVIAACKSEQRAVITVMLPKIVGPHLISLQEAVEKLALPDVTRTVLEYRAAKRQTQEAERKKSQSRPTRPKAGDI